jgi:hypothetical protein
MLWLLWLMLVMLVLLCCCCVYVETTNRLAGQRRRSRAPASNNSSLPFSGGVFGVLAECVLAWRHWKWPMIVHVFGHGATVGGHVSHVYFRTCPACAHVFSIVRLAVVPRGPKRWLRSACVFVMWCSNQSCVSIVLLAVVPKGGCVSRVCL